MIIRGVQPRLSRLLSVVALSACRAHGLAMLESNPRLPNRVAVSTHAPRRCGALPPWAVGHGGRNKNEPTEVSEVAASTNEIGRIIAALNLGSVATTTDQHVGVLLLRGQHGCFPAPQWDLVPIVLWAALGEKSCPTLQTTHLQSMSEWRAGFRRALSGTRWRSLRRPGEAYADPAMRPNLRPSPGLSFPFLSTQ